MLPPSSCLLILLLLYVFESARPADGTRQPNLPVGRLLVEHVILLATHFNVQHTVRVVRLLKNRTLRLLDLLLQVVEEIRSQLSKLVLLNNAARGEISKDKRKGNEISRQ